MSALVLPSCAAAAGRAGTYVALTNTGPTSTTVFWSVTAGTEPGTGRAIDTGRITLTAESEAGFRVENLAAGSYRVALAATVGGDPLLVLDFRVLSCVLAKPICGGLELTNPAENPAVVVYYRAAGSDDDPAAVTVNSGSSASFQLNARLADWYALWANGDPKDPQHSSAGDARQVAVYQGRCRAEVSFVRTTCSPVDQTEGSVEMIFTLNPRVRARFAVHAADGELVSAGSLRTRTRRHEVTRSEDGLEPGRYRVSLSIVGDRSGDPVVNDPVVNDPVVNDTVIVRVLQCLSATIDCRAVTFTNPASNPELIVAHREARTDDEVDQEPTLLRVAPGRSASVRPGVTSLAWTSYVQADVGTFQAGSGSGVDLTRACDADVAPVTISGPIADTGAPSGALLALGAAAVLITVGGLLLVGRRRGQH